MLDRLYKKETYSVEIYKISNFTNVITMINNYIILIKVIFVYETRLILITSYCRGDLDASR